MFQSNKYSQYIRLKGEERASLDGVQHTMVWYLTY